MSSSSPASTTKAKVTAWAVQRARHQSAAPKMARRFSAACPRSTHQLLLRAPRGPRQSASAALLDTRPSRQAPAQEAPPGPAVIGECPRQNPACAATFPGQLPAVWRWCGCFEPGRTSWLRLSVVDEQDPNPAHGPIQVRLLMFSNPFIRKGLAWWRRHSAKLGKTVSRPARAELGDDCVGWAGLRSDALYFLCSAVDHVPRADTYMRT